MDGFRKVFEIVVGSYLKDGLVSGQSFPVDASFIKANVNQMKRVPGYEAIDWPDGDQDGEQGSGQASRAVKIPPVFLGRSVENIGIHLLKQTTIW